MVIQEYKDNSRIVRILQNTVILHKKHDHFIFYGTLYDRVLTLLEKIS